MEGGCRNRASDCIYAAVLILHCDAPRRCNVDGQPSDHCPEVCSADCVAILLEDGFKELVDDGTGHATERNFYGIAEASIGTKLVSLRDVNFSCIMEC